MKHGTRRHVGVVATARPVNSVVTTMLTCVRAPCFIRALLRNRPYYRRRPHVPQVQVLKRTSFRRDTQFHENFPRH